jgi:outer membrane cobalamin receptor
MNNQKQFLHDIFLRFAILVFTFFPLSLTAQPRNTISGEIKNGDNLEQVAFANVALFDSTGIRLIGGAASNAEGMFSLYQVTTGKYKIMVSALGFESFSKPVEMKGEEISLGTIELTEKKLELNDVVVIAERTKAKSEPDKNTFFISQKMQDASNSGTDILNLIPGVSVDIQQNISLEGSRNILILVDGKERDPGFLRQLQAGQIDKVEIISNPPAQYDASVTGVINIIMKKEKKSGLDGHVYAEIPANPSVVLLNPAYSLNFGFGKFNLFTSYNGDMRRFNITQFYNRKIYDQAENIEIISTQEVTQKTWSHRFHYGFDWFLNSRNQINFYGYYNPFSQELDGNMKLETTGAENENWSALKDDDDTNRSLLYSLWYKHVFGEKQGHEITFDMSLFNLKASNSTTFTNEENGFLHENLIQPDNQSTYIKLDYTLPFQNTIKLNTGMQTRQRTMRDNNSPDFRYDENNYAAYGTLNFSTPKLEAILGIRAENSVRKLKDGENKSEFFLLPTISVKYNPNNSQNLKFTYRRSALFPGFYQLNPYASVEDPITVSSGNTNLQPEVHDNLSLEYSLRLKNHFVSTRVFHNRTSDAIRNLMWINESGIFEIQKNNLGDIRQTGILVSGALGFGKAGLNPYFKLSDVYSIPNSLATENNISECHKAVFESGLSAYVNFKFDITATFTFQYTSPMNEIQGISFSDPLYFISLEKTFANKLKAGIVSGIPFTKNFTYYGNETSGPGFENYAKGELHLPAFPIWFKLSYQFSSGKKQAKIERSKTEPESEKRKGF